jgi:hypothetical protein
MKYSQYIENPDRQQPWGEIYDNFLTRYSLENNIAVLLGRSSNGAVCIDFDDKEVFQDFWGSMLDGLLSRTLIEESHHGFHCFFFDPTVEFTKIDLRKCHFGSRSLPIEIKANRTLVTIYPSVHESGFQYRVVSKTQEIMWLDGVSELIIRRAKNLGWRPLLSERTECIGSVPLVNGSLTLGEKEAAELSEIISLIWKEHHHHEAIVGIAGMLLRARISETETAHFLETIAQHLGCKQKCWKFTRSQVSSLYKSSKNSSSHIPGVGTIVTLAQSQNLPHIAQRVLCLNRVLVSQRKTREDALNWMANHGY